MILEKTLLCKNCNESLLPGKPETARFCDAQCRNTYRVRLKRRRRNERLKQFPDLYSEFREKENRRVEPHRRAWALRNPDKVLVYQKKCLDQRRGLPATLTPEDWRRALEYFQNKCAYCGAKTGKLHKDHFIPAKLGGGLTPNNTVPACPSCNTKKQAKDPADWLAGKPGVYERVTRYLNACPA